MIAVPPDPPAAPPHAEGRGILINGAPGFPFSRFTSEPTSARRSQPTATDTRGGDASRPPGCSAPGRQGAKSRRRLGRRGVRPGDPPRKPALTPGPASGARRPDRLGGRERGEPSCRQRAAAPARHLGTGGAERRAAQPTALTERLSRRPRTRGADWDAGAGIRRSRPRRGSGTARSGPNPHPRSATRIRRPWPRVAGRSLRCRGT
jgi:hypothetical protein